MSMILLPLSLINIYLIIINNMTILKFKYIFIL